MLAWQKFGKENSWIYWSKGDKLVGYYVISDKAYKGEIAPPMSEGKPEEEAKKQAPII
jgi:arginyl-tRNA synthetase